jgi:hypothetical protein
MICEHVEARSAGPRHNATTRSSTLCARRPARLVSRVGGLAVLGAADGPGAKEGIVRTPPHFREELHPEELVRKDCPHPWLAALAIAAIVLATGLLLHAVGPIADDPGPPTRVAASQGGDAGAR